MFQVGSPMNWELGPEWHVKPGAPTESWLDPASIPTAYGITFGTLPAGISMDTSTGVISGTPTEQSPLRPDLPDDPTDRANPVQVRITDIMVQASNSFGSTPSQMIRLSVV